MTLGEKIKEIRKKFGYTQEKFAELLNVSRQAVTKWETDAGLPDTENLKQISKIFGVSIDSLLDNESNVRTESIKIELNPEEYGSKLKSYDKIIEKYFPAPWEVYSLVRERRLSRLENVFDFLVGAGTLELADSLRDLSPWLLAKNGERKMLVNIKDWVLTATPIPSDINEDKFVYDKNKFIKIKNNINEK